VRPMADKPQHPLTIELDGARLRPLCVADAAALYAYLRDPVVTELTSYGYSKYGSRSLANSARPGLKLATIRSAGSPRWSASRTVEVPIT